VFINLVYALIEQAEFKHLCSKRRDKPAIGGTAKKSPLGNKPSVLMGAYPRWRGGNIKVVTQSQVKVGLSPLARGKLLQSRP